MASYRIEKNAQYNSNEIYFDSKPAAEVLTALRGLKMRWNPKKGCWYGFAAQNDILAAIGEHDNELGGTVSGGYLGAPAGTAISPANTYTARNLARPSGTTSGRQELRA